MLVVGILMIVIACIRLKNGMFPTDSSRETSVPQGGGLRDLTNPKLQGGADWIGWGLLAGGVALLVWGIVGAPPDISPG